MLIENLLTRSPDLGLAEVALRRNDILAQLADARARRATLLLHDESDRAIAACDEEADRLHLALERLNAAEIELRGRYRRAVLSTPAKIYAGR